MKWTRCTYETFLFYEESLFAVQAISPIATHFFTALSFSQSVVCCLLHSSTLLKRFDGFWCVFVRYTCWVHWDIIRWGSEEGWICSSNPESKITSDLWSNMIYDSPGSSAGQRFRVLPNNSPAVVVELRCHTHVCAGSQCRSGLDHHQSAAVGGPCRHQGYVRRLPRVQYVSSGVVVRNVSLESFRFTGGYALPGLRQSDANNNHRSALQFTFWRPLTVAAMRFVQTRVGFVRHQPRLSHSQAEAVASFH